MSRRADFISEVAKKARERVRKPRRQSERQILALEEARMEDPMRGVNAARRASRCSARNRKGTPCGAPAMRGTDRCHQHGGRMRAGPDHPGNIRWLLSGRAHRGLAVQNARREAKEALETLSVKEAKLLASVLPANSSTSLRNDGVLALCRAKADGGETWRRWLSLIRFLRQ